MLGPILNAHLPDIAEIMKEFGMVQPSVIAEIGDARTWKIGTVRTASYIRFVCGA
jgi:hypothetical protein